MKKRIKRAIIAICIIATGLLASCAELLSIADAYDSGSRGYSYIGTYSSYTACRDACANRGGSSFEYSSATQNCYCK